MLSRHGIKSAISFDYLEIRRFPYPHCKMAIAISLRAMPKRILLTHAVYPLLTLTSSQSRLPPHRPGLLIPSLKSDPRRRHGLLFTNENCKYERAARVSMHDYSRGRGQLIIALELIKSGKHANALFIFQSDGRSSATTDRVGGAIDVGKSEEIVRGIRITNCP